MTAHSTEDNTPIVRFLDRGTAPHLGTLIVLTAFSSLVLNLFLPSLPAIAASYGVEYAVAQLAISFFLASSAAMQLLIGPASDRYGRRKAMLFFIALGLVATLGIIYSPTIEFFLAFRILQGVSVAGIVISRAIVRDMHDMASAASKIGYVTMAMSLAPMVGPIVGGWLSEHFGWQSNFWLLFVFGAAALLLAYADQGETNRNLGGSFTSQFAAYPQLFRSRRLWGYTGTATFSSGAFFAFVGGGPYLATVYYDLSPSIYGFFFAFAPVGYITRNFLAGRFSKQIGVTRMAMAGSLVICLGMVIAAALALAGATHPLAFFACMTFVGLGNGIALPNSMAGIVSVRPQMAGSASGLGGFVQMAGAAVLSSLAGILLGPQTGPMPLILLMLACGLASTASAIYVRRVERGLEQYSAH